MEEKIMGIAEVENEQVAEHEAEQKAEQKVEQKAEQETELLRELGGYEFRKEYEKACRVLEKTLQKLNKEMSIRLNREYISSIEWRVKSPESCIGKMKHKEVDLTLENAVNQLNDIAGVRVVCNFLDDMYELCRLLVSDYDFELIKEKDYIKNPKRSGYQSLHLILWVPIGEDRRVKAEIQARTQAMDFWAGVEHHFVYKKDRDFGKDKDLEKDLRKCAKSIYKIDKKMMNIRNRMEQEA